MYDDGFSLFMHAWPWIGLGAGVTILLYNPGLFTSIVLFIPVFIWATYVWVGRDKRGWALVLQDLLVGLAAHVILFGGIGATRFGMLNDIGGGVLMILDAAFCGVGWYLLAKRSQRKWDAANKS